MEKNIGTKRKGGMYIACIKKSGRRGSISKIRLRKENYTLQK